MHFLSDNFGLTNSCFRTVSNCLDPWWTGHCQYCTMVDRSLSVLHHGGQVPGVHSGCPGVVAAAPIISSPARPPARRWYRRRWGPPSCPTYGPYINKFEDLHRNHFLSQDYDLAPDLVHDFHPRLSKLDSELIIRFHLQVTVLDLSQGQSRRERVTLERHTACACHCTVKVHNRSRSKERFLLSISISGTSL